MEFFFLFEGGFKNNVYKYFPCYFISKAIPQTPPSFFYSHVFLVILLMAL